MSLPEDLRAVEDEYRSFAVESIAPHSALIDREERIPDAVLQSLGDRGCFGASIPAKFGGKLAENGDPVAATLANGLLHEALGATSASVQGLLNVDTMAAVPIARWGTKQQKQSWLPRLACGDALGALAITEPDVGSDAAAIETTATCLGSGYQLHGTKVWITCGQIAGLFVLLANSEDGPVTFLLPRSTPGLDIEPIHGMLGCRGYMLAKLHLNGCILSEDHLLGRPRFGLTHVAATALDVGRYNLAWGCVGLARACFEAALRYSRQRKQFGVPLSELQLVQRLIARMLTDTQAARLLCWHAGILRARRDPGAVKETAMAKYFSSTMVNRVASDAVQLHGANGCGPDFPLERYFRDARIMEIIEGTTQILEIAIARYAYQERS